MSLSILNPITDTRWDDLVARHPRSTVFHQRGWLEALVRTYGYEPGVLTSAAPGEPLKDGLLLCRVSSWMTGTRLVSLPFADHCEPLLSDTTEFRNFLEWLSEECQERHWSYVEIRTFGVRQRIASPFHADSSYWFHELDLNPNLEQLYQQLHHNSFRRKIRRAERNGSLMRRAGPQNFLTSFAGCC